MLKKVASSLVVKTLDYELKSSRFQSHKHQRFFFKVDSAQPKMLLSDI